MYSLFLLAFVSFAAALILTPVCRDLARRRGFVDSPDGARKLHRQPIPRVGGVPILAAYGASFGVLLLAPLSSVAIVEEALPLAWRIFPAAALVFAAGLADDLRGLKPWHKLTVEMWAALAAFWAGVQVTAVAGLSLPPWLSLPVTVVWLVGCSNAFNLIDGIDGLATGVGLFATATMLAAALLDNNVPLALATAPLAGSLLGFLRYNFNPASIFLGDSGSLTIGFLLGCYGVQWGQKSATALGMTAPLMALAVPLLDTAVAIARRFLRGQRIFEADRGHIHHRLLARGLTPRKVALMLYGACGLAAMMSLGASVADNHFKGLILVLFCAAAWIGVQHLGYVEFGVAGRMFLDGAFRRHLNHQLALRAFEDELAAAATSETCWQAIREACRKFGFTRVELRLNGSRFAESLAQANGNPAWEIQIPLAEDGSLRLARCFGSGPAPTVLAPFAEALHRNLCATGRSFTRQDAASPDASSEATSADLRALLSRLWEESQHSRQAMERR